MADTYIYRDATSAVAVQKATISFWVKKCGQGTSQYCFFGGKTGDYSSYSFYMKFHTDDTIKIVGASPGTTIDYKTTAVFRDPAAWMHIVIKLDMTETGTDRCIMYINGVEETNYSTQTAMTGTEWYTGKTGYRQFIGYAPSEDTYSSVLLSHYLYVDGLALAPTDFGETDATSGIWKYKQPVVSSYGTNGFYLKMEDSSNMDLDSSGNALTMTTSGTLTATKDNPANNFCTWNPLDNYWQGCTFSNGANTFVLPTSASQSTYLTGTQGMIGGKYYMEIEHTSWTNPDGNNYGYIGIATHSTTSTTLQPGTDADSWCLYEYDGGKRNNGTATTYAAAPVAGDIIGMAVDLVNNKLYFSNNGAWADGSGSWDSSTFDAAVGAITISAPSATTGGTYIPCASYNDNVYTSTYKLNAGGGYLGTTTVGTSNQGAGDIGYFKYPVPTGYYALCTKNIKSQGGA